MEARSEAKSEITVARDLVDRWDISREYVFESTRLLLGDVIKAAIREAGLSQQEVASRIGKHKSFVSQILSGNRNPTIRTISELLWACGKELEDVTSRPIGVNSVERTKVDVHLDNWICETSYFSDVCVSTTPTKGINGFTFQGFAVAEAVSATSAMLVGSST